MYLIRYDQAITYNNSELSGFFYCCGEESSCKGDEVVHATDWKLVKLADVKQEESNLISVTLSTCTGPSSLAYLWAESPVTITKGLNRPTKPNFDAEKVTREEILDEYTGTVGSCYNDIHLNFTQSSNLIHSKF